MPPTLHNATTQRPRSRKKRHPTANLNTKASRAEEPSFISSLWQLNTTNTSRRTTAQLGSLTVDSHSSLHSPRPPQTAMEATFHPSPTTASTHLAAPVP